MYISNCESPTARVHAQVIRQNCFHRRINFGRCKTPAAFAKLSLRVRQTLLPSPRARIRMMMDTSADEQLAQTTPPRGNVRQQTPQHQIRPEEAASQLDEMVMIAEHSVDSVMERDVKGEAACAEADRPEVPEPPPITSPERAVRQALEDVLLFPKPEDQPPPPSPPSPRCVAARERPQESGDSADEEINQQAAEAASPLTRRVRTGLREMHDFAFDAFTQEPPRMRPLVNKPQQDPQRYAWNCDHLEWSNDNTIPDVFAMVEDCNMDGVIWIPIFTGSHFRDFILKFEDLREVLGWDEFTSRAYLLRSIRIRPLRDHLRHWRYEAMVIYLKETYTSQKNRMATIDAVMNIQRNPNETIRALGLRVSLMTAKAKIDTNQRNKLAGAAFRHALRMDPRLVEHLEKSMYKAATFARQIDLAHEYEYHNGTATSAVITDGSNDIAVMEVRRHPPALTTRSPPSNSTESPHTVRVAPILPASTTKSATAATAADSAKADTPTDEPPTVIIRQFQPPKVIADMVFFLRTTTMSVGMYVVGLEEPVITLVDTGAAVSILPAPLFNKLPTEQRKLTPTTLDIRAGNDTKIICNGIAKLAIWFQPLTKRYEHEFYICNEDTVPILGMDFMSEHDTFVHLKQDKFAIDGVTLSTYDSLGTPVVQGDYDKP